MASRRRRWLIVAAVAFVVVSGLCSGGWWLGASRSALDAELAALRERGEPAGIDDLGAASRDDVADGYALLLDAWAWLDEHGPPESEWPPVEDLARSSNVEIPDEERTASRAFAESVEPFLALVRRAADAPELRLGPALRGDEHVADRSRSALLGRTVMIVRAARNASSLSGDARYLELLRLQSDLAAGVVVTGGWTEVARAASVLRRAVQDAGDAFAQGTCSVADARSAVRSALETDAHALFEGGLGVDRAIWLSSFRRAAGDEAGPLMTGWPEDIPSPWVNRSLRAGAVRWSRAVGHVLSAPAPDHAESACRMRGWLDRGLAERGTFSAGLLIVFDPGEALHVAARIGPVHACRITTELAAVQRLFRVAAACQEHYDRDGLWPSSLHDLRGEVTEVDLTDPFTSQPLRFEPLPNGVTISSAGATDAEVWGAIHDPEADGLVWTLRR